MRSPPPEERTLPIFHTDRTGAAGFLTFEADGVAGPALARVPNLQPARLKKNNNNIHKRLIITQMQINTTAME